jgi:hypothetical protein
MYGLLGFKSTWTNYSCICFLIDSHVDRANWFDYVLQMKAGWPIMT